RSAHPPAESDTTLTEDQRDAAPLGWGHGGRHRRCGRGRARGGSDTAASRRAPGGARTGTVGRGGVVGALRQPAALQRALVVGAGNSASEIVVELAEVAAEVLLSVRTPPNIVRRDTLGVPSQLLGIALRRAPERVMNPVARALRQVSVPDLSAYGLPAPPGDG